MQVQSLGQEDPLEEDMATDSSILAWRIQWIEEPGRLKSIGLPETESDTTEAPECSGIFMHRMHAYSCIEYI